MIGIVILMIALLMLCLEVADLSMRSWWPWRARKTHRRQVERRRIPADWNRILKETKLNEIKNVPTAEAVSTDG